MIEVSIICNAFNHEDYIRETLDSFVSQKTSFDFEVLIHDDASTDGTADIIREYEAKYPDIIKPIYQTENQYSKGVSITRDIQIPRAHGKYIAFCEGDDYWTSSDKLQKQFDAMEAHPELDICAHSAKAISARSGKVVYDVSPKSEDTVIPVEEVILGDGGYVASNSLFYRKSLNDNIPEFRRFSSIDYALQIDGSLRGGMLYLSDSMAVYRYLAKGSWTSRTTKDLSYRRAQDQRKKTLLEILDRNTEYKYHSIIEEKILITELYGETRTKDILSPKYESLFNKKSTLGKLKLYIKVRFPKLVEITRKIR